MKASRFSLKLHANSENEPPHIACVIFYKQVITDKGYQMRPKKFKVQYFFRYFRVSMQILQTDKCPILPSKNCQFFSHPPINFWKNCVDHYSTCKRSFENPALKMFDPSLMHSFMSHFMAFLLTNLIVSAFFHTIFIFFTEETKLILCVLFAGLAHIFNEIENFPFEN